METDVLDGPLSPSLEQLVLQPLDHFEEPSTSSNWVFIPLSSDFLEKAFPDRPPVMATTARLIYQGGTTTAIPVRPVADADASEISTRACSSPTTSTNTQDCSTCQNGSTNVLRLKRKIQRANDRFRRSLDNNFGKLDQILTGATKANTKLRRDKAKNRVLVNAISYIRQLRDELNRSHMNLRRLKEQNDQMRRTLGECCLDPPPDTPLALQFGSPTHSHTHGTSPAHPGVQDTNLLDHQPEFRVPNSYSSASATSDLSNSFSCEDGNRDGGIVTNVWI